MPKRLSLAALLLSCGLPLFAAQAPVTITAQVGAHMQAILATPAGAQLASRADLSLLKGLGPQSSSADRAAAYGALVLHARGDAALESAIGGALRDAFLGAGAAVYDGRYVPTQDELEQIAAELQVFESVPAAADLARRMRQASLEGRGARALAAAQTIAGQLQAGVAADAAEVRAAQGRIGALLREARNPLSTRPEAVQALVEVSELVFARRDEGIHLFAARELPALLVKAGPELSLDARARLLLEKMATTTPEFSAFATVQKTVVGALMSNARRSTDLALFGASLGSVERIALQPSASSALRVYAAELVASELAWRNRDPRKNVKMIYRGVDALAKLSAGLPEHQRPPKVPAPRPESAGERVERFLALTVGLTLLASLIGVLGSLVGQSLAFGLPAAVLVLLILALAAIRLRRKP